MTRRCNRLSCCCIHLAIVWLTLPGWPVQGGFTDVTSEAKVDYLQWSPVPGNLESMRITGGAAAGDVDGDGYPDLLVTRLDGSDLLFLNDRQGAFEVSSSAGFLQSLPTNGAAMGDVDNDGDLDVYLTTVGAQRHYLYINDGRGRFTEEGLSRNAAIATGQKHLGMSTAMGDYDRDGYLDLHVTEWGNTNLEPVQLWSHARVLRNLGQRQPGHYDNDGDQDLAMTNGMVVESQYAEPFFDDPMKLWRNNGDGTFVEVAQEEGLTDTGAGKGLLTFDYDLDGDLDLFVVNNGDHPKLYRNDADPSQSFLKIEAQGTQSNRDGIEAFITLVAGPGGDAQIRYIAGGGVNYLSQSEMTVHFGLGQREAPVHRLMIEWPSGISQVFSDVTINQTLLAVEPVPEPIASFCSCWAHLSCGLDDELFNATREVM